MKLKGKIASIISGLTVVGSLLIGMPGVDAAQEGVNNSYDYKYAKELAQPLTNTLNSDNMTMGLALNLYNKATGDKMLLGKIIIAREPGKIASYMEGVNAGEVELGCYVDFNDNMVYMPFEKNNKPKELLGFNLKELLAKYNEKKLENYNLLINQQSPTEEAKNTMEDKIDNALKANMANMVLVDDNSQSRTYKLTTNPEVLAKLVYDNELTKLLNLQKVLGKPQVFDIFVKINKDNQQVEKLTVDVTNLVQAILAQESKGGLLNISKQELKEILPLLGMELNLEFTDYGTTKVKLPENMKIVKGFDKIPEAMQKMILDCIKE